MIFREYRRRETIRLAEITEQRLILEPGNPETKNNSDYDPNEFFRGDFAENRDDKLYGWRRADVETMFMPIRAARQKKAESKGRKRATLPYPHPANTEAVKTGALAPEKKRGPMPEATNNQQ